MDMDPSRKVRIDLKSKVTIATLLVLGALSFAGGFLRVPGGLWGAVGPVTGIAAYGSPLVFLCAGVVIFLRPRLGYVLGVLSGLIALFWFGWTELSNYESTWIFLNATVGLMPSESAFTFVKLSVLRIASAAFIATGAVACLLCLLPVGWLLGNARLSHSTWPAAVVGLLVMTVWFMHAAMPYRVPLIVDAMPAELRILHIQKRSLHFEETAESVYRGGRFFVDRSKRRLFHFEWKTQAVSGVMAPNILDRATALVNSPELGRLHTAPAGQLWSWNAEGWYVVLKDKRLVAFTSEHQPTPPREITDLFQEVQGLPGSELKSRTVHDICLGFCYGPVAALGFQYSNQPCFVLARGATQCR